LITGGGFASELRFLLSGRGFASDVILFCHDPISVRRTGV
jgi:hypothetical protein